jgi:hypothetical protein
MVEQPAASCSGAMPGVLGDRLPHDLLPAQHGDHSRLGVLASQIATGPGVEIRPVPSEHGLIPTGRSN